MRTLALTSPHMKGKDVVLAQHTLMHNVLKPSMDYMKGGAVDGEFGPETARACIRAKYWCGYPDKDMKPTYGIFLHGYLTGKLELPEGLLATRAARVNELGKETLGQRAVKNAYKNLGMKESPPYSNRCPISERWRLIGPWCAESVSEWYIDAGSKAFTLGVDWAYVPYMLNAGLEGRNGLALIRSSALAEGDVLTYDWDHDGIADHTGLFVKWTNKTAGQFLAIEGNTSHGNNSDGGQVQERDDRNLSELARTHGNWLGIIRVGR